MRRLSPIDALFPKIRQRILGSLFMHPDAWRYQNDLAQELSVSPSTLQKEIQKLIASEILEAEQRGNRLYFRPNKDCTIFAELAGITAKTSGLVEAVRELLKPFDKKIDVAFIFGSVARNEELSASDVDLMIIGSVAMLELAVPLRRIEKRINREVNPHVMSREEAQKLLKSPNHFFKTVLAAPKIMLIRNDSELAKSCQETTTKEPHLRLD
jgi:predicted nucleotidyltransferase